MMDVFKTIDINWSALIAITALVLSQLPPVRQMVKGTKLRMSVADIAQFSHAFGNTNMSLWIDLENVGGKTITIKRLECRLRNKSSGQEQLTTAKTYWLTDSLSREKPLELPIAEVVLKPGERWSGYLHFWNTQAWSKQIESDVKSVIAKIRNDIAKKAAERDERMAAVPATSRPLVEADPNLVGRVSEIVEKLKKLEVAEYELLVIASGNSDQTPLRKLEFDLTLFENDVRDIFEDVEDYKYGFGVGLPSQKAKYVQVQIRSK